MNTRQVSTWCLLATCVVLGTTVASNRAWAQPEADGVQVLTSGPVHEAFAETITFNPEPGLVVARGPPEAIEELPPDQRPEGNNVAWIPGYWAWDDERNDFLWVSGIWRNLPPGRQWVPGYWAESGQKFQWISGYWADAAVSEVVYLPEPPATLEAGPNIAAPSVDQGWIPGNWQWNQTRYAWRPGYWAPSQQDWTWAPAHYNWTPRGYVYVDGYWDYSVARRGTLFAPVYFGAGVYSRPGFSYSPATVINTAVFASHLFLRPNYCHYYFGDYYAANYQRSGFYPSYSYNSGRYGYDPICAHERWHHRQDQQWELHRHTDFQHRRDHEDARPPRTWAAQRGLLANPATANQPSFHVAAPFSQFVKSQDSPLRFQSLVADERQRFSKHGHEVQKFSQERHQLEHGNRSSTARQSPKEPAREKFRPSPVVALSPDRLGKEHAPPQRHDVFKPNLQDEPPKNPKVDRPFGNDGKNPKTERPQPQPQPKVDQPRTETPKPQPQPQPQPKVDRPFGNDGKNPRTERPQPQPQPQPSPKIDRPFGNDGKNPRTERPQPQPQPQPTPKVDRPFGNDGKNPRTERPQPQPQPQPTPKVDRPFGNDGKNPRTERPQPQPQPQPTPKVDRPFGNDGKNPRTERPQPQPQPKVDRPRTEALKPLPQPQPQPRVERQPQPQPRAERQPQPQPRAERQPQPQPQPRVERQPQPRAEQPAHQPGGNGPAASSKPDHKGKDKGKD